jgi:hypothetical protein
LHRRGRSRRVSTEETQRMFEREGTYWSDETGGEPNIVGERRVVDAVCGALVGLDCLARLFANDVGMLDDAQMRAYGFGGVKFHETAIVGILLVAQKHQVAFCAVVSGAGSGSTEGLPLNVRGRPEVLAKRRAGACRRTRRRWLRSECRMARSDRKVQMRSGGEPCPQHEASSPSG